MSAAGETSSARISAEIVDRIHAGDDRAWNDLYLRYRDRLLFSIRCRLGPELRRRVESEDILHSVMREALTDLQRFEPTGESSLAHYLHVCVLNKIRAAAVHHRAARRDVRKIAADLDVLEIAAPDAGPPRYLDPVFERLEFALTQLPVEMREVILLRRVEELSNDETARIIKKSAEATSKIHNRALARLGAMLRDREAP